MVWSPDSLAWILSIFAFNSTSVLIATTPPMTGKQSIKRCLHPGLGFPCTWSQLLGSCWLYLLPYSFLHLAEAARLWHFDSCFSFAIPRLIVPYLNSSLSICFFTWLN